MSTIVVGADASEQSKDAIAFALALARVSDVRVVAVCAFPYERTPSRAAYASFRAALEHDARETLRRVTAPLAELGDRVERCAVADLSPAHALHEMAEQRSAELIVVGSTRTGRIGRVWPGSTSEHLLHGAPCSVATVPQGYRAGDHALRRIGAADDGSPEARAAILAAAAVAELADAELEVIQVLADQPTIGPGPDAVAELGPPQEQRLAAARRAVAESVAALGDVRATPIVLEGDPASELAARSRDLDLLVTGSRGYGPMLSVLLGGVSGRLLRMARCPVVVVPRGVEAPLSALPPAAARAGS